MRAVCGSTDRNKSIALVPKVISLTEHTVQKHAPLGGPYNVVP